MKIEFIDGKVVLSETSPQEINSVRDRTMYALVKKSMFMQGGHKALSGVVYRTKAQAKEVMARLNYKDTHSIIEMRLYNNG
jgi:hypothetical protein